MDVGVSCYEPLLAKPNHILQLIPFNSTRKRACTAIKHPNNPNIVRVFSKGGPEVVLKYVSKMFDSNGNQIAINQSKKDEVMQKIVTETFARKAYRTLLIAYREYTADEYDRIKE
jgi:magnesium-transporting ATPase (P-type)